MEENEIIIKTYVHRAFKIPGPEEYGNREATSSLSLEMPVSSTKKEIDEAVKKGRELMEQMDVEAVQPDMARKAGLKPPKDSPIGSYTATRGEYKEKVMNALLSDDGAGITKFIKHLNDDEPLTKEDAEPYIKLLTNRYNELTKDM